MSSKRKRKVFLSYSPNDRVAARKLYDVLKKAEVNVWFAEADLVPGTRWDSALKEAIRNVDTILLLVGPGMSLSKWQNMELQMGLDRAIRERNFNIIPVLLPGSNLQDLPVPVRNNQAIDLREVDDVSSFDRIAATLAIDPESGGPADEEEIGDRLRASGDPRGALPYYEKSLAINIARFGDTHPIIAGLHRKIGALYFDLGDLTSARNHFEIALRINETVFGSDHPKVAIDINNLGSVKEALRDLAGARADYERALNISEAAFGGNHPEVATAVNNLGSVLQELGDFAGAKACYERALTIDETTYGSNHPKVAVDLNNIAILLGRMDDIEEARGYFEKSLKIFQDFLGDDHPSTITVKKNLNSLHS